jgi:hypothetical protein
MFPIFEFKKKTIDKKNLKNVHVSIVQPKYWEDKRILINIYFHSWFIVKSG